MLNDYTRGGQLFLHNIRMLRQVFDKTLFGSFIVSSILVLMFSYKELASLDYSAGITYVKAHISEDVNRIFGNKATSPKITAVVKEGIYAKDISANVVINHGVFRKKFNSILEAYSSVGLNIIYLTSRILFIVILVWSRAGSKAVKKDIIKGSKILTAREVAKVLNKLGKASHFKIGDMPLVKDKETSHILITGTTGSGKSNCMHNLLPQIRSKSHSAIIVDFTGEMVERYYNPERGDAIINPFDEKAKCWDFWKDISNPHNLSSISSSLFSGRGNTYDEMWNNASKIFFEDVVRSFLIQKKESIKDLYHTLAIEPISKVSRLLSNTPSSSMLDPKNDKTAMSIRTNTIAFINWMEYLNESLNLISISDWFESQKQKQGQWLFLTSTPNQRNKLRNFHSMLLDLAINNLMELGSDFNRRIWLIIDELPALKHLPSLPTALSELRKYGGCVMAGMQSANQLLEIYGPNQTYGMLDQFNTKFIFRTDDNNFANYICRSFGEMEYQESNENYSYGAHEMRDGVSFSKQAKKKLVVTPSDLALLSDMEAYVKLPESSVGVARISMPYVAKSIILKNLSCLFYRSKGLDR